MYRFEASTFAGEDVLGSFNKLTKTTSSATQTSRNPKGINAPLDTRQDSRDIVRRAPSILQYIEAEFAGAVDVWVEHLGDEFDAGGFVGVLFFEVHDEAEGAVFEGGVCWADDDGVPFGKREVSCVKHYCREG